MRARAGTGGWARPPGQGCPTSDTGSAPGKSRGSRGGLTESWESAPGAAARFRPGPAAAVPWPGRRARAGLLGAGDLLAPFSLVCEVVAANGRPAAQAVVVYRLGRRSMAATAIPAASFSKYCSVVSREQAIPRFRKYLTMLRTE